MSRAAGGGGRRGGVLDNERGLTLIELMVAVAIIGVLSTTATFSYATFRERARESQLKVMLHNLQVEVLGHVNDFDLAHRWGRNYDLTYLNGYLEKGWENAAYDNFMGHHNPVSKSRAVLVATSVPTSGRLTRPAIFVTNSSTYDYERLRPTQVVTALRGSLVIYLANNVADIDVYFVDLAGRRSSAKATVRLTR